MFSWRDEAYYRSDPWRGKWATEGGGVLVNSTLTGGPGMNWFFTISASTITDRKPGEVVTSS